jgi:hypothetical protein
MSEIIRFDRKALENPANPGSARSFYGLCESLDRIPLGVLLAACARRIDRYAQFSEPIREAGVACSKASNCLGWGWHYTDNTKSADRLVNVVNK